MTQAPLQTSIALVYATGGKDRFTPAVWVDIVNRVVTPAKEFVPKFFFLQKKNIHSYITLFYFQVLSTYIEFENLLVFCRTFCSDYRGFQI